MPTQSQNGLKIRRHHFWGPIAFGRNIGPLVFGLPAVKVHPQPCIIVIILNSKADRRTDKLRFVAQFNRITAAFLRFTAAHREIVN